MHAANEPAGPPPVTPGVLPAPAITPRRRELPKPVPRKRTPRQPPPKPGHIDEYAHGAQT